MDKPNGYYYWIAKEFLKRAYSKKVSSSFYDFTIIKKGSFKIVECFNGGAFVGIHIHETHIKRSGHYSSHRPVNKVKLLAQANELLLQDQIPKYYEIRFQSNISTDERCVTDIEKGKRDVIRNWNICHSTSRISEPIDWIIKEV